MFSFFLKRRSPTASLESELAAAAARFASGNALTMSVATWETAADALRAWASPRSEVETEELLSDAAAFFGESLRRDHGGTWRNDPIFGLLLAEVGGVPHLRLMPLSLARKLMEPGTRIPISEIVKALPMRLELARLRVEPPGEDFAAIARRLSALGPGDASHEAHAGAERFREAWLKRTKNDLPPSLVGVREVGHVLQASFCFSTLSVEWLVNAGFYVGEVARALFGGKWDFSEVGSTDPTRAALAWDELPLYPIGRVFRTVTECLDKEPLEDFVRVIPSARQEMRKKQLES